MTAGSVEQRALDEMRGRYPDVPDDELRQTLTYSSLCFRLAVADLVAAFVRRLGGK